MKVNWVRLFILSCIGVVLGLPVDYFIDPPVSYLIAVIIAVPFGAWFQIKYKVFE